MDWNWSLKAAINTVKESVEWSGLKHLLEEHFFDKAVTPPLHPAPPHSAPHALGACLCTGQHQYMIYIYIYIFAYILSMH